MGRGGVSELTFLSGKAGIVTPVKPFLITFGLLTLGTVSAEAAIPTGYTAMPYLSDQPVRSFKTAPKMQLEKNKDYIAVVDTSKGRIVLDLYESDTPTTVNSFVWLARHHFYDGVVFHRVIDKFVVQAGDPNTADPKSERSRWGTGGPGYSFGLELRKKLNFDSKGILGMARSQSPDSNGSQFYITLAAASSLNNNYTVFGKVTEGLDILDKITKYEAPDAKVTPDKINSIVIAVKK